MTELDLYSTNAWQKIQNSLGFNTKKKLSYSLTTEERKIKHIILSKQINKSEQQIKLNVKKKKLCTIGKRKERKKEEKMAKIDNFSFSIII